MRLILKLNHQDSGADNLRRLLYRDQKIKLDYKIEVMKLFEGVRGKCG